MGAMEFPTMPYSARAQGGVWKVFYEEPSGTLELDFELGIDKPILWVPSEAEWQTKMPDWAQGRRDEIVDRALRAAFGSEGAHLASF